MVAANEQSRSEFEGASGEGCFGFMQLVAGL